MKLVILFNFIVVVSSLTTTQMNYLIEWGVCDVGTIATSDCSWAISCYGNLCSNGELLYMTFSDLDFAVLTESMRAGFAFFPQTQRLLINSDGAANFTLYPEISLLSGLQRLSLSGKAVGTIPSEIALLTNLQIITMSGVRLTGTIPQSMATMTNLRTFSIDGDECNLHGPVPNFPNLTLCTVSTQFLRSTLSNNPNLFCPCNNQCAAHGSGSNVCTTACGVETVATCNALVPTISNGYVCTDACSRCGMDQCFLRGDNKVYLCPGDPTDIPVESSSEPRTTPTIDGHEDEPRSSTGNKWNLF